MEILDQVMELLKASPHMAIWVIVIIFIYKTVVIGSAFSVVRLGIISLRDSYKSKMEHEEKKKLNMDAELDGICVNKDAHRMLLAQIHRIKGVKSLYTHSIYTMDVDYLRKALDEKMEKDKDV